MTLSVGDSDPRLIEDHQIEIWWGCKNADYSSTSRTEYLSCILTTGTFILFDKFGEAVRS
ncbi:MAG: hypothetical protein V7L04_01195 [Nostoc sp.]|uniref:hypothetical protein n=1 Tax=Nostoc sp. TaxID=1180 RepID=UPI002FFB2014